MLFDVEMIMNDWPVFWLRPDAMRSGLRSSVLAGWERTCPSEAEAGLLAGDPIFLSPDHRVDALLAIFAIDQPAMLTADGSLDPYGAATDRQQIVYQHARHLGLPTDPVSPIERRQQYEDAVRAAKEQLRRC